MHRDRLEARRAGALVYLPLKPCKRGHIAPTKVYGLQCETCEKENQEKLAARRRKVAREAAARARKVAQREAVQAIKVKALEEAKEARNAERRAATEARRKERERIKRAEAKAAKKGAPKIMAEAVSQPAPPWDEA